MNAAGGITFGAIWGVECRRAWKARRLGLGFVRLGGLLVLVFCASALQGQTSCSSVGVALIADYQFAAGTSGGPGAYTWTLNGKVVASGATNQLALFHFDNSLQSTSGSTPVQSSGTSFTSGQWGNALALSSSGTLAYPVAGKLSVQDGTVEMWVSPRFDGSSSVYTQSPQPLFQFYWGQNGDQLVLAMGNNGSFVAGAGAGVSTGGASITSWKAGSWHHLAWSYSTTQGRIRLYADGSLVSEFDTAIKIPPPASGASFTVGSDAFGHASAFSIDEVLVSNAEKDASQIQYDAKRITPFGNNEVLLSLNGAATGT